MCVYGNLNNNGGFAKRKELGKFDKMDKFEIFINYHC